MKKFMTPWCNFTNFSCKKALNLVFSPSTLRSLSNFWQVAPWHLSEIKIWTLVLNRRVQFFSLSPFFFLYTSRFTAAWLALIHIRPVQILLQSNHNTSTSMT